MKKRYESDMRIAHNSLCVQLVRLTRGQIGQYLEDPGNFMSVAFRAPLLTVAVGWPAWGILCEFQPGGPGGLCSGGGAEVFHGSCEDCLMFGFPDPNVSHNLWNHCDSITSCLPFGSFVFSSFLAK